MLLHKSGPAAIYAILLGAAAVGVGPRAAEALAQSGADKPPRPSPHPDDLSRRSPGQMFVAVRVLDPDGKPVPRRVMVYAAIKQAAYVRRSGRRPALPSVTSAGLAVTLPGRADRARTVPNRRELL